MSRSFDGQLIWQNIEFDSLLLILIGNDGLEVKFRSNKFTLKSGQNQLTLFAKVLFVFLIEPSSWVSVVFPRPLLSESMLSIARSCLV